MGIELRQPAIDVRVVQFCLGIPSWLFLRNGRTRWLARKAGEGRLPVSLLERERYGAQAADWPEWLPAMRGRLASELEGMRRSERVRRVLDVERMRALVDGMPDRLGPEHRPLYLNMLLRGIMMGRFICWFEERYG
jgi:asparagine synthase (glutamine-hydrolysing)